jgi:NADP-dependent 3-hydroxy acid dehydrogenase YdfG
MRMAGSGRVTLITGASSGIGEALARAFVADGHRVVLNARSADRLAALAADLGPDRAVAVPGDVTVFDDQQRAASAAIDAFGRLEVVVANAGGGTGGGFLDPTADPDAWRAMVLTNVYGVALTARATLPHLVNARGHLLLMGSVAGRVTIAGSLYSATKWAVTGMAQALRAELHTTGVRVTVIQPGKVVTPFFGGDPPQDCLETDDVVAAVRYAVSQPPSVDVNEVVLRPIDQHR